LDGSVGFSLDFSGFASGPGFFGFPVLDNWLFQELDHWSFRYWMFGFSLDFSGLSSGYRKSGTDFNRMVAFLWIWIYLGFQEDNGLLFYIELIVFIGFGRLTHTFTQGGKEALEKSWKFWKYFLE
jgi:hypothetical protein